VNAKSLETPAHGNYFSGIKLEKRLSGFASNYSRLDQLLRLPANMKE
jgi:hypothetical protein